METQERAAFDADEIKVIENYLAEGLVPERIAEILGFSRSGFVRHLENSGFEVETIRRLKRKPIRQRRKSGPKPRSVSSAQTVVEFQTT